MEDKPQSDGIELTDGSVFSIGGVQSTLSKLVDADKITDESVVFSIGPSGVNAETDDDTGLSKETASPVEPDVAEHSAIRTGNHKERYLVAREIARGGMGSILMAEDSDLRRFVAMKVLLEPGEVTSAMCERFVKEAQITGFLEHPNIVPVHELGIDEQARPFFTMKLIEGESLGSVLDKLKSLDVEYRAEYPLRRLLGVLVQVCNALSFAHDRGVIHRDIKPENIMIGRFGEVLVMDWGLSKIGNFEEILAPRNTADPENYNQTQEGVVIGTPPYMPPEQAKGNIDETDERSDVFSLGAILYEMVTGLRLYRGSSIAEIISKAASTSFEPPSKIPNVSDDLAHICMKALKESKEQRYQTVAAFSDQIKAYLDHRVIPEYSVTTWRKLLQSAGVVVFFLLLIPAINLSGFRSLGAILSVPSVIMVLGTAASFQIIVVGWRVSFFGKMRRRTESVSATYGSIVMQEGTFWGGLLGFLSGYLSMLGGLDQTDAIGPKISLALITTLYFYGSYIVFRLDSIRELRKNSLFDAIAENSYAHFARYVILLVLPMAAFFFMLDLSTADLPVRNQLFLHPGFVPAYPAPLYVLASGFTLVYCRFVFTIKEMIAAFEHACAYLAGNDVSHENRIHAAAVIRMLVETFMLTIAVSVSLIEVNFLANLASATEIIPAFATLIVVGAIPLILYVLVNFLFIPRFLGYRGAKDDHQNMNNRLFSSYSESRGAFWSKTRGGRRVMIIAILCFSGLISMSLVTSGAIWSMPVAYAIGISGSVLVYANLKRFRLRRKYEQISLRRSVHTPEE